MTRLIENMAAAEAGVSFHHALNITQKEKDVSVNHNPSFKDISSTG